MDSDWLPGDVDDLPGDMRAVPPATATRFHDVDADVELGPRHDWLGMFTLVVACVGLAGLLLFLAGWIHSGVQAGRVEVPGRIDVEFLAERDSAPNTATMVARCDQMGGELIFDDVTHVWTCEDVDK
jgi:hypothetical protein